MSEEPIKRFTLLVLWQAQQDLGGPSGAGWGNGRDVNSHRCCAGAAEAVGNYWGDIYLQSLRPEDISRGILRNAGGQTMEELAPRARSAVAQERGNTAGPQRPQRRAQADPRSCPLAPGVSPRPNQHHRPPGPVQ